MYFLLNSIIVPRPIAWVSTLSADGVANLAPHSYSTVASVAPATLLFTSIKRKDTIRNLEQRGEFVVNVTNHAMVEAMNITAADAPPEVSEFDLAGLELEASSKVAPPRVAASPVAIECELDGIREIGTDPAYVVFGRVVAMHYRRDLLDERGRIDPGKLDAVARMGGSMYSTTRDRFELRRPRYEDLEKDR
jgi:flavin reductase (DIM6/NTAB) family NADH-FMN oxidoreductase RutF